MTSTQGSSLLITIAVAALCLMSGCAHPPVAGVGRFPHQSHLDTGKLNCYSCHSSIVESTSVDRLNGPTREVCKECHKADSGPGTKHWYEAENTYTGSSDRMHVSFSHKGHYITTKGQCVRCHRDVQTDVPTPGILPEMAVCLTGCHQADYDRLNCTRCHRAQDLVKLRPRTDIPHGEDYLPRHHTDAMRAKRLCMVCHDENHCASCHDTSTGIRTELQRLDDTQRTFRHRGDILTRHSIEARANPTACVRCHQPNTCDSCHVRNRLSGNSIGSTSTHPAGWMGADSQSANFHGRAARRRIIECAACHDQGPATNCVRCHKVGAYGGSPHPPGWHSSQSRESTEMCQFCHSR